MKKAIAAELHKPARRRYPRRKFTMRAVDETWQADLVDMQAYSRVNKGYNFLLTVIDNFSKYAWAIPLKNKTGTETTKAFKTLFNEGRVPKNLHVDDGKEFFNSHCKALMESRKINMYSTYSGMKASTVERFNRTLKQEMWREFTLRGSYKWIDILDRLLEKYNDTKHRTIKMKPNQVTRENQGEVLLNYKQYVAKSWNSKFQVGDPVRVSKNKHIFEKGYTPNWTTEIFTVTEVCDTIPTTYKLKDYRDEVVSGGFYDYELLKVKHPDVYLVEKVLKKRGNQLYVKWLGFDSSHNSWIDKENL